MVDIRARGPEGRPVDLQADDFGNLKTVAERGGYFPLSRQSESITVSSTAIPLSPGNIQGAVRAEITVEDQAIRFWKDGSIPTSTAGHEATDGDVIVLTSYEEIEGFRAIRRDATNATLRVSYSGRR